MMRDKFRDSYSAIRAACELEGNPGRPLTSRMLDKVIAGDGSNWEDAAFRAGTVWQTLQPLKGAPIAILVARATPRQSPCSCRRLCCSGHQPHPYWMESINILAAAALAAGLPPKRYDERKAILLRIFGEKLTIDSIANAVGLDRHTVGKHARDVEAWIGVRSKNGLESQSWDEAERLLMDAGMLEADM